MVKVCTSDLDGILNSYPDCWVKFVNNETGLNFGSKQECRNYLSPVQYANLKDKYRRSDFKANLEVNTDALEFFISLKRNGYFIVVTTSRPFEVYPLLAGVTRNWLIKKNVPFDVLEKKTPEVFQKYGAEFHIDDEIDFANFIAPNFKNKIFLLDKGNDLGQKAKNIIVVKSFKEITLYL